MTDTTLDALLEAVRDLTDITECLLGRMQHEQSLAIDYRPLAERANANAAKLYALIKQRKGRPDDQPANPPGARRR